MRILAIVLLLAGPIAAHAADKASIPAAQKAVAAMLKDPGSAQFRNVHRAFHDQAVCGEVNGKNAFGGYVGFRPFVVKPDGKASIAGEVDALGNDPGATDVGMWCHD